MARPAGEVIVHFDVDAVAEASGRAFDRAARQVATEIEAYMIGKMSRPNPTGKNPSAPGQYPKMVSAALIEGVRVTGTRNGVTVYSRQPYGRYLDEGTDKMAPRPWATRALFARDWMARIARLAREFTGGSRRRSK
jgi:hypothetical protein